MANGFYESGLRAFAEGSIDWVNDDIRIALVDTGVYTVNLVTHDFYDDVVAGEIDVMGATLAGKATANAGECDATDPTITGVTGTTVEALVVFKYNASDAAAALICYIDSATANLPFTPNGSDVTIQIHANGLFAL